MKMMMKMDTKMSQKQKMMMLRRMMLMMNDHLSLQISNITALQCILYTVYIKYLIFCCYGCQEETGEDMIKNVGLLILFLFFIVFYSLLYFIIVFAHHLHVLPDLFSPITSPIIHLQNMHVTHVPSLFLG